MTRQKMREELTEIASFLENHRSREQSQIVCSIIAELKAPDNQLPHPFCHNDRYYRLNGTRDLEPGETMLLYDSTEDMLVLWKFIGPLPVTGLSELHAYMEKLGFPADTVEEALWDLDAARKDHEQKQQTEAS